MSAYVYKYEAESGEPIYIGIATNLKGRLAQHGKPGDNIDSKHWDQLNKARIYYVKVDSKNTAEYIESALVRKHMPIANIAKKNSKYCDLKIEEPEWLLYEKESVTTDDRKKKRLEKALEREKKHIADHRKRMATMFPDALDIQSVELNADLVTKIFTGEFLKNGDVYIGSLKMEHTDIPQIEEFVARWNESSACNNANTVPVTISGNRERYYEPNLIVYFTEKDWNGKTGNIYTKIGQSPFIEHSDPTHLHYVMPSINVIFDFLCSPSEEMLDRLTPVMTK